MMNVSMYMATMSLLVITEYMDFMINVNMYWATMSMLVIKKMSKE